MKINNVKHRRLFIGICVSIVILFLITILSSVYIIIQKMESSAAATAQHLLDRLSENLSSNMQADENAIQYLADTIYTDYGQEDIQRQLASFQEDYDMLDVFWMDSQGETYNGTGKSLVSSDQRNFTPETLTGFSEAFWGSYGVWETDYRISVVRDGAAVGSIYVCIPLSKYEKNSCMTYYEGRGMAYMFDTNTRKIVMLPSAPNVVSAYMQNINDLFQQVGFTQQQIDEQIYPAINQNDSLVLEGMLEGKHVYAALVDLPIRDNWYICGIVPTDALLKEAGSILWLILLILVCMSLFMLFIFWLFIHWSHQSAHQRLEQLNQAEMQNMIYDTVGDASDTVLCVFDRQKERFEVIFHNISRILGIDAEQLMNTPAVLEQLLNSAEPGLYHRVLEEEFPHNTVYHLSYDHPIQHELRDIRLTLKHISIQERDCIMLVAEDITNDMRIQTSLHAALENANQANQAKSEFLSRMSHDIRTPINAIIGMREIAIRHLDNPERLNDCLNKIQLSSSHLLGLVNDILVLSKIESGKLSLHYEPFCLSDTISNVMDIIQNQALSQKQSLSFENKDIIHTHLIGNEMRLKQILINLLNNAVKYTQEGGCITLTVQEKPSSHKDYCAYYFIIQDNGIGMTPEFLEKIGRPFEQESSVFHKSELGSGLGLAIVKNLVSIKGGFFTIESQKDVGTTVQVELSFQLDDSTVNSAIQPKDTSPYAPKLQHGKRVLVVEDNELNREIAVELLAEEDLLIETAVDGMDAVEKFQRSSIGFYDLILMDLQMPRMDGYTATRKIRSMNRADASSIVIIAMTANAFAEDVLRCKQAGMNEHLSKPIEVDKMYAYITKALDENATKRVPKKI